VATNRPADRNLAQAVEKAYGGSGRVAVIAPSVSFADFDQRENVFSNLTLVAVHGYGPFSFESEDLDPIWRTLLRNEGRQAVVLPGVDAEESLLVLTAPQSAADSEITGGIRPGNVVRLTRGFDSALGTVVEMPDAPMWFPSGYRLRAAVVRLADGTVEVAPRDNMEVLSASTLE
jgi:hypothetical protein